MKNSQLDLVRQVLDRQLLDSRQMPCGKVDDIELAMRDDGTIEVTAILVGPGASLPRLPALFEWIGAKLLGRRVVRVPWEQVSEIPGAVKLNVTADSLQLDESRGRAFRIIEMIPWSSRG